MLDKAARIADEQRRARLNQNLSNTRNSTYQEQAERQAARNHELTRQAEERAIATRAKKT